MLNQVRPAIALLLLMTVITGIAYPLMVTGVAQLVFEDKADGSLIEQGGQIVGSDLIGQSFIDPITGETLLGYLRGRPSAAGSGYDAALSSGSNLGPTNPVLVDRVTADVEIIRTENGLANDAEIPIDLVTTSGSGLDPHISPASARLQIARVAHQRGITEDQVRAIVEENTSGRTLGLLGEPRVNVLNVNLALDEQYPMP